jgi:NAD(P)-dependent dehydrogenase (short-subunit alcohol dehydrogenase family)
MESKIPAGRFARPEEIAALVVFLMSPPAGYITGATLTMDGGLTASMGLQR